MDSLVFVPDMHLPIEDTPAVKGLIQFIDDFQPDEVIVMGDLMDFKQPSRWSKDTRAEFEGSVYRDCEYAQQVFLDPLRAAYSGPVGIIEGNHDVRPRDYLEKNAPALSGGSQFDLDVLLGFSERDIDLLPWIYVFADDWAATHGHIGGISMSKTAGVTALNAANTFGLNIVCGHSHRLGMVSETEGYVSNYRTLTGIEVGHLVDVDQVDYMTPGVGNWQEGFAVGYRGEGWCVVNPIPIVNDRFVVEGQVYDIPRG